MKKINTKALICTVICLIIVPLCLYGVAVNEILFYIFIIITTIFFLIALGYGLYVFFDEFF